MRKVNSTIPQLGAVTMVVLGGCLGHIGDPGGSAGGGNAAGNSSDGGIGADGGYNCSGVQAAVVDGRRITSYEYNNAIGAIFNGLVTPSTNYPGSYGTPVTGFSTESVLSTVGAQSVQQIMMAAEDVAQSVAAALPTLLPCSTTSADDTCAGTFIDTFARRAYRRTLQADERTLLLGAFDSSMKSDPSFSDGIAMVTDTMLQSPQFLYVMEGAAPKERPLTSTEMASRLSFLFWDSIPDDTLLSLADSNSLTTAASVLAQAQRLAASPKATATIVRFFREWTTAVEVGPENKDTTAYSFLTDAYAASMNESFDRFVTGEMLNKGTLRSLLTSTDAWVDSTMAQFFGVAAPASGQWTKVTLDASRYAGITTHPVLMASLAHPSTSSFVLRGEYVRKRLLCDTIGAPPANAQQVFATFKLPPNPTGKDVSAAILSNSTCATCHGLMNPAGLAFENFDGIGRYQTAYPSGKSIDPSGVLPDVDSNVPSLTFSNQIDLMEKLAAVPDVTACFDKQIVRFALSRMDSAADVCTLQTLGAAMSTSSGQMMSALMAMAGSDAFRNRVDQ
jgi:hypothetical protein